LAINPASIGLIQPGKQPQQSRFPATRLAASGDEPPFCNRQIQALQHGFPAEPTGHALVAEGGILRAKVKCHHDVFP